MSDKGYIKHSEVKLTIAGLDSSDVLKVNYFRGEETLSSPYCFEIGFETEKNYLTPENIFGKLVTLIFYTETDKKIYENYRVGYVSDFNYKHLPVTQGGLYHYAYDIRIVPRLALLDYHQDSRIFKDKSALEIIENILKEHGYHMGNNADFDLSNITGNMAKQVYPVTVQYEESDLQFIQRLSASCGLFYFFKHTKNQQTLVFTDNNLKYPKAQLVSPVYINPEQVDDHANILGFSNGRFQYGLPPTMVSCNSYNLDDPSQFLKSNSGENNSKKDYVSTHKNFGQYISDTQLNRSDLNKAQAQLYMQQQSFNEHTLALDSTLTMLNVGYSFDASDPSFQHGLGEHTAKQYAVTRIIYHFERYQPQYHRLTDSHGQLDNVHHCTLQIEAIPTQAQAPRIKLQNIAASPVIGVIHHGFILNHQGGIESKDVNANPDDLGMPMVGLHWDQMARQNANPEKYIAIPCIYPRPGAVYDVLHPGETVKLQFSHWRSPPYLLGATGDKKNYKLPLDEPRTQTKFMSRPTLSKIKEVNQVLLDDKPNQQNLLLDAVSCFNIDAAKAGDKANFSLAVDKDGNLVINAKSITIKTTEGDISFNSAKNIQHSAKADISHKANAGLTLNANNALNAKGMQLKLEGSMGLKINSGTNVKISAPQSIEMSSMQIKAN